MSMFQRLFCCCLPFKKDAEHYECLIPKGVSEDVPSQGVPSHGVPSMGVPPTQHAFTSPLVHVHVTTIQDDAPFTCCNGCEPKKGSLENKPKEKVVPSKAPVHLLASAPNVDCHDPVPWSSQLQWATFSNDMNTCQKKGALWRP